MSVASVWPIRPLTAAPMSSATIATGTGLFAACAALQATTPTLVPVIGVNTGGTAMPYGAANGAPSIAQVANADGLVDLFNSAASSAMGTLQNPKDAALYEAKRAGRDRWMRDVEASPERADAKHEST